MPTLTNNIAFQYTQSAPAGTWNIAHNLNRYPIIDVYTDTGGSSARIMPLTVTYIDPNNVQLTFSNAITGLAVVL